MNDIQPWILWAVLAAILMIGEIFTAGVFLIFFGIGAIPAVFVAYFHGSLFWQLMAFIASSGVLLAFARPLALRLTKDTPGDVGPDRVIGKNGVVLDEIDPKTGSGRVRIEREEWRAESDTGEKIPADTWVEVLRVEGTRLVVKPISRSGEENK